MKGWLAVFFFLEKHHYPFDLQVGPLLGTRGGELAPSGKILESTLRFFYHTLTLIIDSIISYAGHFSEAWVKVQNFQNPEL